MVALLSEGDFPHAGFDFHSNFMKNQEIFDHLNIFLNLLESLRFSFGHNLRKCLRN